MRDFNITVVSLQQPAWLALSPPAYRRQRRSGPPHLHIAPGNGGLFLGGRERGREGGRERGREGGREGGRGGGGSFHVSTNVPKFVYTFTLLVEIYHKNGNIPFCVVCTHTHTHPHI